jgi:hypothetical protein
MNTFTKSSVSAVLTVLLAGAVAAPTRAAEVFESNLPSVSSLVAETGMQIAQDVASYFRAATSAPRTYAKRRSPSVEITAIESVVVVASRLPATEMETVTVVATRLPIETIVVEATRLPAIETVVVEASRLPGTDENGTVVVASATPVRF